MKYFAKKGSPRIMNDFYFSFYYLDMSLRLKVTFFFECLRTNDSIGKEMAPYFIAINRFSVNTYSLDLDELHSR